VESKSEDVIRGKGEMSSVKGRIKISPTNIQQIITKISAERSFSLNFRDYKCKKKEQKKK